MRFLSIYFSKISSHSQIENRESKEGHLHIFGKQNHTFVETNTGVYFMLICVRVYLKEELLDGVDFPLSEEQPADSEGLASGQDGLQDAGSASSSPPPASCG